MAGLTSSAKLRSSSHRIACRPLPSLPLVWPPSPSSTLAASHGRLSLLPPLLLNSACLAWARLHLIHFPPYLAACAPCLHPSLCDPPSLPVQPASPTSAPPACPSTTSSPQACPPSVPPAHPRPASWLWLRRTPWRQPEACRPPLRAGGCWRRKRTQGRSSSQTGGRRKCAESSRSSLVIRVEEIHP